MKQRIGRMTCMALVAVAVMALGSAIGAEPRGLLVLAGQPVKWGSASFGSGAELTFAFLDRARSDPQARNCREMIPLDGLLARSAIAPESFRREVLAAFAVWAAAADLTFREVPSVEAADIVIGAQLGSRGVAYANVHQDRSAGAGIAPLSKASICLDPGETWEIVADGNPDTFVLSRVMVHEIGHAIGLDHYGRTGGLMGFAYLEPGKGAADLHPSALDLAAVTRLYGPLRGGQLLLVGQPEAGDCDVVGAITPAACPADASR